MIVMMTWWRKHQLLRTFQPSLDAGRMMTLMLSKGPFHLSPGVQNPRTVGSAHCRAASEVYHRRAHDLAIPLRTVTGDTTYSHEVLFSQHGLSCISLTFAWRLVMVIATGDGIVFTPLIGNGAFPTGGMGGLEWIGTGTPLRRITSLAAPNGTSHSPLC
jgi:hypothetical protein